LHYNKKALLEIFEQVSFGKELLEADFISIVKGFAPEVFKDEILTVYKYNIIYRN
jgi:hypothetical protein